ncbi:hypothetical protein D9M71_229630 [compost metagenome]
MGQVQAAGEVLVDLAAEVGEVALVLLPRVVAEAVLAVVVGAEVAVEAAEVLGHRGVLAVVVEAAGFQAQVHRRCGLAGGADEVDRPAEVGRAVAPGVGAAQHFDVVHRQRFDGLEVEAAVGQVDRRAVLHQQQAAAVEGALQAGAADRQARFLGAEARLDEHAGGEAEGVLQGAGAAGLVGLGVDQRGAAGDVAELGLLLLDGRRGGVELVLADDGGVFHFQVVGLGQGGEADVQGEHAQCGNSAHGAFLGLESGSGRRHARPRRADTAACAADAVCGLPLERRNALGRAGIGRGPVVAG